MSDQALPLRLEDLVTTSPPRLRTGPRYNPVSASASQRGPTDASGQLFSARDVDAQRQTLGITQRPKIKSYFQHLIQTSHGLSLDTSTAMGLPHPVPPQHGVIPIQPQSQHLSWLQTVEPSGRPAPHPSGDSSLDTVDEDLYVTGKIFSPQRPRSAGRLNQSGREVERALVTKQVLEPRHRLFPVGYATYSNPQLEDNILHGVSVNGKLCSGESTSEAQSRRAGGLEPTPEVLGQASSMVDSKVLGPAAQTLTRDLGGQWQPVQSTIFEACDEDPGESLSQSSLRTSSLFSMSRSALRATHQSKMEVAATMLHMPLQPLRQARNRRVPPIRSLGTSGHSLLLPENMPDDRPDEKQTIHMNSQPLHPRFRTAQHPSVQVVGHASQVPNPNADALTSLKKTHLEQVQVLAESVADQFWVRSNLRHYWERWTAAFHAQRTLEPLRAALLFWYRESRMRQIRRRYLALTTLRHWRQLYQKRVYVRELGMQLSRTIHSRLIAGAFSKWFILAQRRRQVAQRIQQHEEERLAAAFMAWKELTFKTHVRIAAITAMRMSKAVMCWRTYAERQKVWRTYEVVAHEYHRQSALHRFVSALKENHARALRKQALSGLALNFARQQTSGLSHLDGSAEAQWDALWGHDRDAASPMGLNLIDGDSAPVDQLGESWNRSKQPFSLLQRLYEKQSVAEVLVLRTLKASWQRWRNAFCSLRSIKFERHFALRRGMKALIAHARQRRLSREQKVKGERFYFRKWHDRDALARRLKDIPKLVARASTVAQSTPARSLTPGYSHPTSSSSSKVHTKTPRQSADSELSSLSNMYVRALQPKPSLEECMKAGFQTVFPHLAMPYGNVADLALRCLVHWKDIAQRGKKLRELEIKGEEVRSQFEGRQAVQIVQKVWREWRQAVQLAGRADEFLARRRLRAWKAHHDSVIAFRILLRSRQPMLERLRALHCVRKWKRVAPLLVRRREILASVHELERHWCMRRALHQWKLAFQEANELREMGDNHPGSQVDTNSSAPDHVAKGDAVLSSQVPNHAHSTDVLRLNRRRPKTTDATPSQQSGELRITATDSNPSVSLGLDESGSGDDLTRAVVVENAPEEIRHRGNAVHSAAEELSKGLQALDPRRGSRTEAPETQRLQSTQVSPTLGQVQHPASRGEAQQPPQQVGQQPKQQGNSPYISPRKNPEADANHDDNIVLAATLPRSSTGERTDGQLLADTEAPQSEDDNVVRVDEHHLPPEYEKALNDFLSALENDGSTTGQPAPEQPGPDADTAVAAEFESKPSIYSYPRSERQRRLSIATSTTSGSTRDGRVRLKRQIVNLDQFKAHAVKKWSRWLDQTNASPEVRKALLGGQDHQEGRQPSESNSSRPSVAPKLATMPEGQAHSIAEAETEGHRWAERIRLNSVPNISPDASMGGWLQEGDLQTIHPAQPVRRPSERRILSSISQHQHRPESRAGLPTGMSDRMRLSNPHANRALKHDALSVEGAGHPESTLRRGSFDQLSGSAESVTASAIPSMLATTPFSRALYEQVFGASTPDTPTSNEQTSQ